MHRAAVALALSLPLLSNRLAAAPIDNQAAVNIAASFAESLAKGKYADAAKAFDETMSKAVTLDKLQAAWEAPAAQYGGFRSFGTPAVQDIKEYKVVLIPCEYAHGSLRLQLAISQTGRVAGMFWKPGETAASMPAPPPPPATVTQRDVKVGGGEWVLPATLTLPKSGKPRAGIVLVHGSGPQDRDETIGFNKPFLELAWGLGAKGIATLRYDKRTLAHRDKMLNRTITIREEVLDDALAALATLRRQPEMAGVPIFLLGHSLGGSLAPEIAHIDGKLTGVILMAGVARGFADVLLDQAAYLATFQRDPETKSRLDEFNRTVELLRAHKLKPGESLLGADAVYWYDLAAHSGQAALDHAAKLKCAVLVLQGGRDYQATSADFALWQKAVADNPKAACKLFDDLNHLFAAGKGKATPMEYTADQPLHVDPRVIELIAQWSGGKGQAPATAPRSP